MSGYITVQCSNCHNEQVSHNDQEFCERCGHYTSPIVDTRSQQQIDAAVASAANVQPFTPSFIQPQAQQPAAVFSFADLSELHHLVKQHTDSLLHFCAHNTQNVIDGAAAQQRAMYLMELQGRVSAELQRVEALEKAADQDSWQQNQFGKSAAASVQALAHG